MFYLLTYFSLLHRKVYEEAVRSFQDTKMASVQKPSLYLVPTPK